MPTANYVRKRAITTSRGLAGSFLEQLPMSGLAVFLWLGSSARINAWDVTGSLLPVSVLTLPISWAAKLLSIARQRMKRMPYSGLVEAHKAVPSELVLRGGAGI